MPIPTIILRFRCTQPHDTASKRSQRFIRIAKAFQWNNTTGNRLPLEVQLVDRNLRHLCATIIKRWSLFRTILNLMHTFRATKLCQIKRTVITIYSSINRLHSKQFAYQLDIHCPACNCTSSLVMLVSIMLSTHRVSKHS